MHAYYDVDQDGSISYQEFVNALQDNKLSERKQGLVDKLWAQLDTEGIDKCRGTDIIANLQDESMADKILEMFPQTRAGEKTGHVNKDEFYQMMCEESTHYPNDDSYCQGIQKIWAVQEDDDAALDNTRVMHLLGLMRQRLLTKANAQQEEFKLRDMFRIFDRDNSGALSINELAGMLAELGVAVKDNEIVAMMKVLDTSKNGVIEFEEFQNFLVVDPYTKYKF